MPKTKTVLVVDDSRVSRMMVRRCVQSRYPDWIVEEAGSGEEALAKAKQVSPALIILDVNMEGMSGMVAAEVLRRTCPDARITLLTANVQDATRNKAVAMGIGFIKKPITDESIHRLIDELGDGHD